MDLQIGNLLEMTYILIEMLLFNQMILLVKLNLTSLMEIVQQQC